jgi:SAM-dependent methyltransferase
MLKRTLTRGLEVFFSPASPVAIYKRPRRLATSLFAMVVNWWLRLLNLICSKRSVVCNVCGWRGRKFGYLAAVSVDCLAANEICLKCGSNRRTRVTLEVFESIVSSNEDGLIVLDIGPSSSTRRYFERRSTLRYFAVDRFADADLCSDVTSIALADNSVGAIICCHVLEHIEDYRKAIGEFYRILEPGRLGIVVVPQSPNLRVSRRTSDTTFQGYGHLWEFGNDFSDKLNEVGFRVSTVYKLIHSCTLKEPIHIVSKP